MNWSLLWVDHWSGCRDSDHTSELSSRHARTQEPPTADTRVDDTAMAAAHVALVRIAETSYAAAPAPDE